MILTIAIIEFIAICLLAIKLHRVVIKFKFFKSGLESNMNDSVTDHRVQSDFEQSLIDEITTLKDKIGRYHEETSKLNRKIYSLKQELKVLKLITD